MCPFWSQKLNFILMTTSVTRKIFPDTKISDCNYHFIQSVSRRIQNIGLTVAYKKNAISPMYCCFVCYNVCSFGILAD